VVLSDTVILNSATTTPRDHAVVDYLERVLALDAHALGREMFESTADVSEISAHDIIRRDAKRYQVRGGQEICIAQVEVVGDALLERRDELLTAMRKEREDKQLALYALMVTDVLEKGTEMLVAGDAAAVARSLGVEQKNGTIDLPGVMSRKKEVAPKLMSAL
jgi:manganese-dependent inorganic pyrophosphatase